MEKDYYKVTVRNITVKVKKDVIDNIDFLEYLSEAESGNALVIPKLLHIVFSDKDYEKVKKALQKEGIVKASEMTEFMGEVLTACNALEAKN